MPLFEFECRDCRVPFEEFASSAENTSRVTCPKCGADRPIKKLGTFSARSGSASSSNRSIGGACGRCGDPGGPCGSGGE